MFQVFVFLSSVWETRGYCVKNEAWQISGAFGELVSGSPISYHRLQNPATKNWAQKKQLQVGVHNSTYRGVITYNPTETYLFIFGHFDPENPPTNPQPTGGPRLSAEMLRVG